MAQHPKYKLASIHIFMNITKQLNVGYRSATAGDCKPGEVTTTKGYSLKMGMNL